jgi:adenylate kinase
MNLLILGPQGSGKGTQARILADKLGLFYLEMGDFLRDLAKTNPEVDEIVNKKGELLPNDMFFFAMKKLLEEKIAEGKGLLLEGFPRSIEQYQMLKNWFNQEDLKIDKAIFIEISKEETIKRLSARRTCEACGRVYNLITDPPKGDACECGGRLSQREDDTPARIEKRLEVYNQNTKPLIEVFEKEGILLKVDGERPIQVIADDLLNQLTGTK